MKRIIGFIIVLHIAPCAFIMFAILEQREFGEYGLSVPYVGGLVADAVVIILYGIVRFTMWCFDD